MSGHQAGGEAVRPKVTGSQPIRQEDRGWGPPAGGIGPQAPLCVSQGQPESWGWGTLGTAPSWTGTLPAGYAHLPRATCRPQLPATRWPLPLCWHLPTSQSQEAAGPSSGRKPRDPLVPWRQAVLWGSALRDTRPAAQGGSDCCRSALWLPAPRAEPLWLPGRLSPSCPLASCQPPTSREAPVGVTGWHGHTSPCGPWTLRQPRPTSPSGQLCLPHLPYPAPASPGRLPGLSLGTGSTI